MKSNEISSNAQIQGSPFNKEEFESYTQAAMETWQIPGLAVAIVKDGKTVLSKGYGTCEVNSDVAVDKHTLFPITYSTLSFTACAIALLVGEGKMHWNDRIKDLFPLFRTGSDLVTQYATVIDALAQRTGLQNEMSLSLHSRPQLTRREILDRLQYFASTQEFRSAFGGGKLANVAFGEIITVLTEVSWDDFIAGRLFKPIGMTDSITGPHKLSEKQNIATLHSVENDRPVPVQHTQNSNIGPIVSIYSSAADMSKWLKCQLNNGKVEDKVVIPEKEIAMIRSAHMAMELEFPGMVNQFSNAGLGLLITDSCSGHKIYSYGGGIEGTESYHAFIPELKLGIAIMANANVSLPQMLTPWIIDRYTHAPYKDWVQEGLSRFSHALATYTAGIDKLKAIADPTKPPTLPLSAYEGIYNNPILGDLVVQVSDGYLNFNLAKVYEGTLKHSNFNTFYPEVTKPHSGKMILTGAAQFNLDEIGDVASLFMVNKVFKRTG